MTGVTGVDQGRAGEAPLGWGILGTATIARKNWKAIANSGNGRVVAVASRDLERSRQFIRECQAQIPFDPPPRALGSYEELLARDDVEAIYIPLPTALRAPWVKRAALAGKHVLSEKPCARNLTELREMIAVCRANRVQFADGVMFMHSGRLESMRRVLDDGHTVGRLRRLTSTFSFCAGEEFFASNIRARGHLEPHGCLGDLGWYCIRLMLWAVGWRLPRQVTGRILSDYTHAESDAAVPTEFSAELLFEGGISGSFYCSFLTENEQWAMISGDRGHLWVPDFVLPFAGSRVGFETGTAVFDVQGCDFEMHPVHRRRSVGEFSQGHPSSQESRMFRDFTRRVRSGGLDGLAPEIALKTQAIMEACLESARAGATPVVPALPESA